MSPNNRYANTKKTLVTIISKPGALSVSLVESLLAKRCVVLVVKNREEWEQKAQHIRHNINFKILSSQKLLETKSDYLVYLSPLIESENNLDTKVLLELQSKMSLFASEYVKRHRPRTIIVGQLSEEAGGTRSFNSALKAISKQDKENTGVIYVGDVIGPRLLVNERKIINRVIKDFVLEKAVRSPKKEINLYPTSVSFAAENIIRNLFSFGPFNGEELLLAGPKYSLSSFLEILGKYKKETTFVYDKKDWKIVRRNIRNRVVDKKSSINLIKETFDWFDKNKVTISKSLLLKTTHQQKQKPSTISKVKTKKSVVVQKEDKAPIKRSNRKTSKRKPTSKKPLVFGVLFALLVLLSPMILSSLALGTTYLGIKAAENDKFEISSVSFHVSKNLSRVSKDDWGAYLKLLDVVGVPDANSKLYRIYNTGYQTSLLNEKAANIGVKVVNIVPEMSAWIGNVANGNKTIEEDDIKLLALELGAIHKELGFLQGEIEQIDTLGLTFLEKYLSGFDTKRIREYVLASEQLVLELNGIFGKDGQKTYLVLFENNMELRPTGGYIEAIALVTFSEGKLTDYSVMDTKSVDDQIEGYIEAPKPLSKYTSQSVWTMGDSNWNSDFPTSAVKAEWFLDKSTGNSVDGVIAVDLEFIKNILDVAGSIYIKEIDKEVNSDNIYELSRSNINGSRLGNGLLTPVARELLNKLTNLGGEEYLRVAKSVLISLEEKHALVFFHDQTVQKSISELGWDGSVKQHSCSGNCYADFVGYIDANVGENTASYFVERNADFTSFIRNNFIKRKLSINIVNNAEFNPEEYSEYKTYLRVLVPVDSKFEKIEIVGVGGTRTVEPDIERVAGRTEAGVFVKIEPGDTKTVNFIWEGKADLDFDKSGEYLFEWRKQPGTNKDMVAAHFVLPDGVIALMDKTSTLTHNNVLGYNTDLLGDISSKVNW